jgi:hypothetical protein
MDRRRLDTRTSATGALAALLAVALLALAPSTAWAHSLSAQEAGGEDTVAAAEALGPDQDTTPAGEAEGSSQADPTDTLTGAGDDPAVVPGEVSGLAESLERLREALELAGEQAVRAARDLSLVVHDDYRIPVDQLVEGNVALIGGSLEVAGTVDGDVLMLDGQLDLTSSSHVTGDVIQVGGALQQSGGRVDGQIVSVGTAAAGALSRPDREAPSSRRDEDDDDDDGAFVAPYRPDTGPFWDLWRNIGSGIAGLFTTAGFFLLFALLGIVSIALAPDKFHVTADTTRHSFGRSFLVGLAGQFLFLPAIVALALGIVTAVLIPFFILAVCLAHVVGYLAAGQAAGEAVARRNPSWRDRLPFSGRYEHLLTGLLLLVGLFALAAVMEMFGGLMGVFQAMALVGGITVTWVTTTAGFGAVLLSRAGSRREWSLPSRETPVPDPVEEEPDA